MKKFLFFAFGLIAVFLSLTFAYDGMNLALVRSSSGNGAYKMERFFGELDEDEIPILGSSRAQANFVPSELDARCFNYGIDGSPIGETLFQLRDLVSRKKTGAVLVNVDPWGFAFFDNVTFRGGYLLAAKSREVRRRLPHGVVNGFSWLPGIRFQGQLRANLAAAVNTRLSVTKEIDCGAVLLRTSRTDAEWSFIDKTLKPTDFGLPSEACQAMLDEIARIVKAREGRLRVVFVIGPCSPSWCKLFTGGDALRKWVKEFNVQMADSHLQALDLFSDSDFGRKEFADPTHLNRDGAARFSRELKRRLTFVRRL